MNTVDPRSRSGAARQTPPTTLPQSWLLLAAAALIACADDSQDPLPSAGASAGPAAASGTTGGVPSTAGNTGAGPAVVDAAGSGGAAGAPTAPGAEGAAGTANAPAAGGPAPSTAGTSAMPDAMPTAGSGPAAAGAAGAMATAGAPAPSTGPTLPAVDDPSRSGPFDVTYVRTAEGLSSHALFVPGDVGTHGKNPVVVWTCGNGGTISFYQSFLDHLASHGFFVVADKGSSSDRLAEVQSQADAIAWVIAENDKSGGTYSGKLDVANIAVMGHSLGSLASFATAAMSEHITTSIHFSGGLTDNPVGFDETWLANMTKPAAFLCGANDTTAGPSCAKDFMQAPTMLPVFYATLRGADHLQPFASVPAGGEYGRAAVAWLRWQLAEDETYRSWFAGSTCTLCNDPSWTAMQRNLE